MGYFKDRKMEKQIEKELRDQELEIEKGLEPDKQPGLKEIFELLKTDEEDIEYKKLLTDEELKEEMKKEHEEKRLMVIAGTIFITAIIATLIFVNVYYDLNKSDLLKITQPMLEDYYEKKYNSKPKIEKIEEITVKDENYNDIPTGIVVATTKNNEHLLTVNNELIGDDISINKINQDFLEYMKNNLSSENIISHNVELSYKGYYIKLNRFNEYIDALPNNYDLNSLLESNKLTVTYKLSYQNNINLSFLYELINKLSEDSCFYIIKQEVGLPKNLTIITKTKSYSMDITASIEMENNITYYELDRNVNGISTINIGKISDSSIKSLGDYDITSVYTIEYEEMRTYQEETKPTFYLLKFNNNISLNTIKQLSTSKNSEGYYEEDELDNYNDMILFKTGGYTYLISDNELSFGIKTEKKSFLCNLGIC